MSLVKSQRFLSDAGINSAQVLSNAIVKAVDADWNLKHCISNSILLSSCMLGSIYLFSTSLIGLNKKWIKGEKVSKSSYEYINGSIMLFSGYIMMSTTWKAFRMFYK
jgi:hypothetical protein